MNNRNQEVDLSMKVPYDERYEFFTGEDLAEAAFTMLQQHCHAASYNRGWWHDPITGLSLIPGEQPFGLDGALVNGPIEEVIRAWFPLVIAAKISLIHSEVSEGLEAFRVDATDDKIDFPGITAEMGDVIIRVFDLMECLRYAAEKGIVIDGNYRVIDAILTKLPVNKGRVDHDFASRKKKF